MTVILLILKIIGIVLLALLGLLVLISLAAVFWPIGYRVGGSFEEDEREIHAGLHWLCYLVCLRFRMAGDEQRAVLYILGIPKQIYPVAEKKRRHDDAADREQEVLQTLQATSVSVEEPEAPSKEDGAAESTDAYERSKTDSPEKTSRFGHFLKNVKRIFRKIKHFLGRLPDKLKAVYSGLSEWSKILTDEGNQSVRKADLG